ncbi:MAG: undecaprenyl/decaprenyl-phosphate alpha-N-acetylglucosaminyl 1-phosphate transferase [Candidatus Wallbacteria bacterium]|nr:undecaprenyl/decaprenyl-phosphate alpha-N-acetylglucosaminyl 1-phosphate transferase [Candidatus Wallbacteria bacterium]
MEDYLPFLAALLVAAVLTPVMRRWAVAIGAVDHPDPRKVHRRAMPRLGGIAVYAGFWTGVLLFGFAHRGQMPPVIAGIFMGSLSLVLLGIYDDIGDAPVRVKFPVQIAAAHLAYFFGVRFDLLGSLAAFFGVALPGTFLGFASYALTILWIVGVTNAINFMDGLDGLATGIAMSVTISLVLLAQLFGAPQMGPILGALVGGLAGFAWYNRYPATIFLGDTGSTFLGFLLANFTLLTCHRADASLPTRMIPFLLLTVPLSDALYAIVRRLALGANVFQADRGHLHHRLLAMGNSPPHAANLLSFATLVTCLVSFLLVNAGNATALAVLAAVAVVDVALAVRLRLFDRHVIEAGVPGLGR